MKPAARKEMLKRAARQIFAERGYAVSGLAEIAERADVSKTLLYHYFPGGRPQLMVAVMDDILGDMAETTAAAFAPSVNDDARVERTVEALLAFFMDQPDAFRLLFHEPWGSNDDVVKDMANQAMSDLSAELALPIAHAGASASAMAASSSGTAGFIVAIAQLLLAGQVELDVATTTGTQFILGGLTRLAA